MCISTIYIKPLLPMGLDWSILSWVQSYVHTCNARSLKPPGKKCRDPLLHLALFHFRHILGLLKLLKELYINVSLSMDLDCAHVTMHLTCQKI